MRARRLLTGNNVLLRRVRRYTTMPTLLRATYQTAPAAQMRPASETAFGADAVYGPVVQATLEMPTSVAQVPAAPKMPARAARGGKATSTEHLPPAQPSPPLPETPLPVEARPTKPAPDVQPEISPPSSPTATAASQPTPASQSPAGQGDDWSWISQAEWNRLKTVMAGHQEKAAQERAEAAEVQLSPEELQQIEARKRAKADLARRQELARAGQLPRAQVVYLSPEEKALRPVPPTPPEPAASLSESDENEALQADQGQTVPAAPEPAIESPVAATDDASESGPAAAQNMPVTEPAPALAAASEPTAPAPDMPEDSPNIGRRILKAARSLFRQPDAEVETAKAPPMPAQQQTPDSPAATRFVAPSLEHEADTVHGRSAVESEAPGRPEQAPTGQQVYDPEAAPQETPSPETPAAVQQAPADLTLTDEVDASAVAPSALAEAEPGFDTKREGEPSAKAHTAGETNGPAQTAGQIEGEPVQPAEPEFHESKAAEGEQDAEDTVIASLPLQEVWPVEEKWAAPEPASTTEPTPKPATSQPAAPAVQRKTTGGDQVGDEVHSALSDVAPGQATDSSIELVTPRRPRPPTPEQRISRQLNDVPPSVDRLAPAQPDPATVERPVEPYMVETEIGELPSDLWSLLGERPPMSQSPPPSVPAAAQVQRDVALTDRPADLEASGETQIAVQERAGLVTQLFQPPAIQQVDAGRSAAGDETSQAASAADEPAEPAGEQEIDVDKLARQVLPEIKRRLQIDWERGRGRIF